MTPRHTLTLTVTGYEAKGYLERAKGITIFCPAWDTNVRISKTKVFALLREYPTHCIDLMFFTDGTVHIERTT